MAARIVGIEAINQLENAYKDEQGELPKELHELRKNLQMRNPEKIREVPVACEDVSGNLTDNMQAAFKSLEEWISTNAINNRAEVYMARAIEQLSSPLTEEEALKVIEFYKKVIEFFKEYKLLNDMTIEQTYMMAAFASIMQKTERLINEKKSEWGCIINQRDLRKIRRFFFDIQERFNQCNCERYVRHKNFDGIIQEGQRELFRSHTPKTPDELSWWIAALSKDKKENPP